MNISELCTLVHLAGEIASQRQLMAICYLLKLSPCQWRDGGPRSDQVIGLLSIAIDSGLLAETQVDGFCRYHLTAAGSHYLFQNGYALALDTPRTQRLLVAPLNLLERAALVQRDYSENLDSILELLRD